MLVSLVFNPSARDGRAGKKIPIILKAFVGAGIQVEEHRTTHAGHAVDIAYSLRDRSDLSVVVAIGGDGTVHEVASGLRGSNMHIGMFGDGKITRDRWMHVLQNWCM